MNTGSLVGITTSVLLSSSAQILLKLGMSGPTIQRFLKAREYTNLLLALSQSWGVLGGLAIFALSVAIWLVVLSSVPLSTAYPFVALGICVTSLAGYIFFGEALSTIKAVGLSLILIGLCLMAVET